jgi:hypothetical protein
LAEVGVEEEVADEIEEAEIEETEEMVVQEEDEELLDTRDRRRCIGLVGTTKGALTMVLVVAVFNWAWMSLCSLFWFESLCNFEGVFVEVRVETEDHAPTQRGFSLIPFGGETSLLLGPLRETRVTDELLDKATLSLPVLGLVLDNGDGSRISGVAARSIDRRRGDRDA